MKKLLFDFFPIILFFVAFKLEDDPKRGIMIATAVVIAATLVQVGYMRLRHGRVEKLHLVTLVLVVALGGLTLALDDERFIKWKPTLVNWAFALVFLGSQFIGSRPVVRRLMESRVSLSDGAWTRLNLGWTGFFVLLGAANLYVAHRFSTDVWVDFKLFGILTLTLLFIAGQTMWLMRQVRQGHADIDA